ncbi:addiction module antidote protein, HigA family [Puteibacter caeruleilacunae]|nr:addiction module antidote protein, HigA family [Puteibacter caeruleilacunae]
MLPKLIKIKGIHPGAILRRELKKRGIKGKELAFELKEHAQTISAILNERRGITPNLSIKLSSVFNVDIDYFMQLQACYEVNRLHTKTIKSNKPDLTKFRHVLFWDTDINNIDWQKNKKAIIKRIFERGNEMEISEIINFYGKDMIKSIIKEIDYSFHPAFEQNIKRFTIDHEDL